MEPDLAREVVSLRHRTHMAYELGAWALGVEGDIHGDKAIRRDFMNLLFKQQPDLFKDIARLDGRMYSILIDGCANFPEQKPS